MQSLRANHLNESQGANALLTGNSASPHIAYGKVTIHHCVLRRSCGIARNFEAQTMASKAAAAKVNHSGTQ